MQGIGIGPALRKARLLRGKSIEEASRETRIRAEYLQALEREKFEALLGDVYVRGFLRSYSTYLGLDPSKVLTIYNRHFGGPRPTLPQPTPGPIRRPRSAHPHFPQLVRHHPSWAFLIGVALLVLLVFAAAGLLTRSRSAPESQGPGTSTPSIAVEPPTVTMVIRATQPVDALVREDGLVTFQGILRTAETRTFAANNSIEIELDEGGLVAITVNGHRVGKAGEEGVPFIALYSPESFRRKSSTNP